MSDDVADERDDPAPRAVSSYKEPAFNRANLPIYIAVGVIALIFVPIVVIGFGVLATFGWIVIRSAVRDRQEGWPWGLAFGLMLFVFGLFIVVFWLGASVAGPSH